MKVRAGSSLALVHAIVILIFCAAPGLPRVEAAPPGEADIPLRNWSAPQYWLPSQPAGQELALSPSAKAAETTGSPRAGVTPLTKPLVFIGITPCRVIDTRGWANMPAPFGAPAISAYSTRSFPLRSHPNCVIPPEAKAYSLNLLAIPYGPLSFLSAWPAGYPYPYTSFLNSSNGDMVNNAVIIAAGVNGGISILAGNPTELIVDLNGYYIEVPEPKNSLGGVISANGTPQSLPTGWTSSRSGTGQYVITFPAGTFSAGSSPAPVLSPIGAVATLQGASIVKLADGSGTLTVNWSNDVAFSFVVAAN